MPLDVINSIYRELIGGGLLSSNINNSYTVGNIIENGESLRLYSGGLLGYSDSISIINSASKGRIEKLSKYSFNGDLLVIQDKDRLMELPSIQVVTK